MSQYMLLRLPAERGEQLRSLAKNRGVPMTHLVGEWINREIRERGLPDQLPGFDIGTPQGKVVVKIDDRQLAPMTAPEAREFASTIEQVLNKSINALLNLDLSFSPSVTKIGTGIAIEADANDGGERVHRVVTPSVARDVARLVRAAADKAAAI